MSLFSPLGGTRGTAAHHPARHIPPHLQANEDLHERGPRQEAKIRHDCAHPREDARQMKTALVDDPANTEFTVLP